MVYDWAKEDGKRVMIIHGVNVVPLDELNRAVVYGNGDQRPGQLAFNILFEAGVEGIEVCRASTWDPFYNVKTLLEWNNWARDHLLVAENDGVHYVIGVVKCVS